MLTRRVIACLDVDAGQVVKGVEFESLRRVGDPVEMAERYEREGADEIVFLDISASAEGRATVLDLVRRTSEQLFIPLTLGGGIRTAQDVARDLFGGQCMVASIDAKREGESWRVYSHGGRKRTELEAVAWAKECARRGAGEILLTSIDRDGVRGGYDLALTRAVSGSVDIPVIASGGAGSVEHLVEGVQAGADAVLLAGILHDRLTTVGAIKSRLAAAGIPVRKLEAQCSI